MKTLIFALLLFTTCTSLAESTENQIFFDRKERLDKMPRYRTAQTPFLKKSDDNIPTRLGLNRLPISASGQPTENEIQWIKRQFRNYKKIIFVDLRNEKHGYINGEPILWNQGPENQILPELLELEEIIISDRSGGSYELFPQSSGTEKQTLEKYGIEYIRFPTRHAQAPNDDVVDAFVNFVKNIEPKTRVHLHCREGWSRTTLYFAMYDMLKNAHLVPREEILRRQYLIGGANMAAEPSLLKQYNFLKEFYKFAKLRKKGMDITWSEYAKTRPIDYRSPNYLHALQNPNPAGERNQAPLPSEILQQDFFYLNRGCSSTAFQSDDGKYILKLYNFRDAKTEEEEKKRFAGYELAMGIDRENTGMLYWHLYKTNNLNTTANVVDKIEKNGESTFAPLQPMNLDDYVFAIQLKTTNLGTLISRVIKKNEKEKIQEYLHEVFELYNKELKLGLLDIDPNFIYNIGFIGNKPIRYDSSHLRKFDELDSTVALTYKKGVLKHFMKWIQKRNYEDQTEIMENVVKWIAQFP